MKIACMESVIFMNKQNIPWDNVKIYLKQLIGSTYVVAEYGDRINIGTDFPEEFTESRYTKKLRGGIAKAKANAAQVIGEMIAIASNRRWVENKEEKHNKDASLGWYRYDTFFAIPVRGSNEEKERVNVYRATLVVRKSIQGMFLYDITNIKKEASKPL